MAAAPAAVISISLVPRLFTKPSVGLVDCSSSKFKTEIRTIVCGIFLDSLSGEICAIFARVLCFADK